MTVTRRPGHPGHPGALRERASRGHGEHRGVDPRAVDDRWAALLVLGLATWVVLPRLVQSITAPKYAASVGVESPPLSRLASLSSTALWLALVALCIVIVVDRVKEARPGRLGGLVVMLAPWLYLSMRDLFIGLTPHTASLTYPILVTTLWMLRPRLEVLRFVGYVTGAAAALSIALAVALPSKGLLAASSGDLVSETKAIISSGILVGFLTHGNNLGQFLALGLPFILLIPHRRWRGVLLAITTFALLWTAARSLLGAVVVGALAMAVTAAMHPVTRRWLVPVLGVGLFVLGAILPLVTTDPRAFTNRGLIWSTSLGWWRQSPLTGLGSDYYARVGKTSERLAASVFSGHNQFVQLLVTGGVVLVVMVLCQLVMAASITGELAASGQLVAVGYLGALAGACVLEKSLAIVDNAPMLVMTALPLTVLLCGADAGSRRPAGRRTSSRPGPLAPMRR